MSKNGESHQRKLYSSSRKEQIDEEEKHKSNKKIDLRAHLNELKKLKDREALERANREQQVQNNYHNRSKTIHDYEPYYKNTSNSLLNTASSRSSYSNSSAQYEQQKQSKYVHTSTSQISSSTSIKSSDTSKSLSSHSKKEERQTLRDEKTKLSKIIHEAEVNEIFSEEEKSPMPSPESETGSESEKKSKKKKKSKKVKQQSDEENNSENSFSSTSTSKEEENEEDQEEDQEENNEETNEDESSSSSINSDQSMSQTESSSEKSSQDSDLNKKNKKKKKKNNKEEREISSTRSSDSEKDLKKKESSSERDETSSSKSESSNSNASSKSLKKSKSQSQSSETNTNSSSGEEETEEEEEENFKKKKKKHERKHKRKNETDSDENEKDDSDSTENHDNHHHRSHRKKKQKKSSHHKKKSESNERLKHKHKDTKEKTPDKEVILDEEKIIETSKTVDVILPPPPPPVVYYCAIQGCRSVEEFECLNKIEEGAYGVVYRAKDKKSNQVVALKRLKMEKEREGFPITSIREVDTLLKSQHPNVVTVREIVVGSNMDKIYMVMDYVEHDLKSLMQYSMKKPFLMSEVKTLMLQILRGVAHLHDNWIIHRDLKTSNLLLSHKGVLKIADFGLAREYGSPLKEYTPVVVTLWYRSPELLLNTKKYSTSIDIWSVGCIFGELMLMKALFPGKNEKDQLDKIFKDLGTPNDKIWPGFKDFPITKKLNFPEFPYNTLRSRFGNYLSDKGFELINKLLTYDPERRISADEALKHTFFIETPLPVDETMFPTWPAKSEGLNKNKIPQDSEPRAPSAGKAYEKLLQDDDGFVLNFGMSAGFHLK